MLYRGHFKIFGFFKNIFLVLLCFIRNAFKIVFLGIQNSSLNDSTQMFYNSGILILLS